MLLSVCFIFAAIGLTMSYENISDVPIICATVFSVAVLVVAVVEEIAGGQYKLESQRLDFEKRAFEHQTKFQENLQEADPDKPGSRTK